MIKQSRLLFPFLAFFVVWLFLLATVFSMQVVNSERYHRQSENNAFKSTHVFADRGKIMDRNGVVLADIVQKKNERNETVYERVYPMGKLASQIIGKMGKNAVGSFGLEKTFEDKLHGKVGMTRKAVSVNRKEVYGLSEVTAEAEAGKDLVLTIDASIQEAVENVLEQGVEEYQAKSASAVVIDPMTGEILAAASYPTFDPNLKSSGVGAETKCGIFTLAYEPGSTFKVITALAGLEENVVTTTEMFDDEHGCWKVPGGKICEHGGVALGDKVTHQLNMAEGMAKSSNIVYGKIAERVGKENFYRFVRNFGFGSRTSRELPAEEMGMLRKPHDQLWSGRTLQTMGFGHELLVTPIQMTMAYAAVANGGILMEPRLVLEWRDSSGKTLEKSKPVVLRRMVSENIAANVREMLLGVVNSGTGTRVNSKLLPEIVFGGKTGTAEKYKEDGTVDTKRQVASFIGLAPALNPKYVCLVLVDEPTVRTAGGTTAGPMFRRIMERIYFNPETSPRSYKMLAEVEKRHCELAWNGMTLDRAETMAKNNSCALNVVGKGDVVLSSVMESADSVTLMLGSDRIVEMPNLNGMPLKDALKVLGDARLQVEFTGKGRVAQQVPKPYEKVERGQICKLVLKEKV